MQPGKVVDAEIGKHHSTESENRQVGYLFPVPPPHHACVQQRGIYKPGDQGPGLFGVPGPVAAPGRVGPDRPGNDPAGEKEKAEKHHPVGEFIEHIQFGHVTDDTVILIRVACFDQVHEAGPEGDGDSVPLLRGHTGSKGLVVELLQALGDPAAAEMAARLAALDASAELAGTDTEEEG